MVQIIQICRLEGMAIIKTLISASLLLWHFSMNMVLANSGSYIAGQFAEKEGDSQEISTIEEEELSALMGEKEDYKTEEDPSEDDWED